MLSVDLKPEDRSWWSRFKAQHLVSPNIRDLACRGNIQFALCEIAEEMGCPVEDVGHPLYIVYTNHEELLEQGFRFQGFYLDEERVHAR